jgi:hypothetical protein
MAELTTKIVLLAHSIPAAHRALAAMKAATDRNAHGFDRNLLADITRENERFAGLLATIPMDPAGGTIQNLGFPAEIGPEDPEPYSFIFDLTRQEVKSPTGMDVRRASTEVVVKIVTTNPRPARRDQEVTEWLAAAKGQGQVRAGLWIVVGQDEAIGSEGRDRSNRTLFLDQDLRELAVSLLKKPGSGLSTVVMSIGGFEHYLLDTYRRRPDESWERPFDLARERAVVENILAALLRQATLLHNLLSHCANWQHEGTRLGQPRLAVVQPMSSNGFFSDDGAPNVDRATGSPLMTPDGMVEDFKWGSRKSSFPRTNRERRLPHADAQRTDTALPFWLPYLTADALMAIVLQKAGTLALECSVFDAGLPKRGRLPDRATN